MNEQQERFEKYANVEAWLEKQLQERPETERLEWLEMLQHAVEDEIAERSGVDDG